MDICACLYKCACLCMYMCVRVCVCVCAVCVCVYARVCVVIHPLPPEQLAFSSPPLLQKKKRN